MLESGLMPRQVYNILNKMAKGDDEKEALSHLPFDSPTERDLFFQQKYVIDATNDLRNFLRPHLV
jgi:hypothetical protein